ncbi:MAG: hypothetical protein ACLFOY_15300 [Desulfatibacillaceae bacterium]
MKTLIGGSVAAILGLIGLAAWWEQFMALLAGAIPITLLVGGALAIYLGFDELKDQWQKEEGFDNVGQSDEAGNYKKEVDDLKKEIDSLKSAK